MLEAYLKILELGYFEVQFAFEGLADESVWKRPHEGIPSIGEQAGHIAFWEAVKFAGEGQGQDSEHLQPDLSKCRVTSPLIDSRFAYYPITLATPPAEHHLTMTAAQVYGELLRVHNEATAHLRSLNPDLASSGPGWPPFFTYDEIVKYAAFHVAYHTGQMYSVRHLLGDTTPDN